MEDKQVKDNQIIYENWMQTLTRRAEAGLRTLTIRKPVVKHIPVTIWSETDANLPIGSMLYGNMTKDKTGITVQYTGEIRNSGGRTYLVTKQGDK